MAFTPGLDGKFRGGPADVTMGFSVCCFPGGSIGQTVNQRVILRGRPAGHHTVTTTTVTGITLHPAEGADARSRWAAE